MKNKIVPRIMLILIFNKNEDKNRTTESCNSSAIKLI